MLLSDIQEHKIVLVEEGLLCLYFPVEPRTEKADEALMVFVAAGLPCNVQHDPWDRAACKFFCEQNMLLFHDRIGDVIFAVNGSQNAKQEKLVPATEPAGCTWSRA